MDVGIRGRTAMSNERHEYVKQLNQGVTGLKELHNVHDKKQFQGRCWIPSAVEELNEEGKCDDPAAGVTIHLSNKMADKVLDSGHGLRG